MESLKKLFKTWKVSSSCMVVLRKWLVHEGEQL